MELGGYQAFNGEVMSRIFVFCLEFLSIVNTFVPLVQGRSEMKLRYRWGKDVNQTNQTILLNFKKFWLQDLNHAHNATSLHNCVYR